MAYEAKNYDHLKGAVKGLSDSQLEQHFTLYKGYVAKLNEIEEKLASPDAVAQAIALWCSDIARRKHADGSGKKTSEGHQRKKIAQFADKGTPKIFLMPAMAMCAETSLRAE